MRRKAVAPLFFSGLFACQSGSPVETTSPNVSAETPNETEDLRSILAASDLPDEVKTALPGDPMKATVHRLSNGLTVYISTDRQAPRFNAWITVRTGGRNDPADSTGLAHYLEHMLFKGSDELGTLDIKAEQVHVDNVAALYDQLRGADDAARAEILKQIDAETQAMSKASIPNEFDNLYSSLGITGVNAFTSEDATVYISDVPSNRLDAWARVEAERFQDPVFRLFFPELEAVYEEKNRSLDNPGWRVFELIPKMLFPKHPYGTQTVIGEVEHLKTPAYGDMSAYFDRWYQPNNIAIVLAGDIDAAAALPVLEKHFGSWQPQALEQPTPGAFPALSERVFTEIKAKGEQSVHIAWSTAQAGHDDAAVLVVMDAVANNSTTGILDLDLVLSQKLPQAYSNNNFSHEAGYWSINGVAKEGQKLEDVEALLMGVIEKLARGEFTDEAVEAVKLSAEIQTKRQLESPKGRVGELAQSFINHRQWTAASQDLARLRAVTRADVIRVAKAYLGAGRAVVYRRAGDYTPPRITKPSITPIKIDPTRESVFARSIRAMPADNLEPEWAVANKHYARTKLTSGELLSVENRRNDLFRVSYRFEEGSRRRPLLCFALDLLQQSGSGDLDATALRRKAYAWGTTTKVQCSADSSTITIEGIDHKLEESIEMLDRWLRSPNFDDTMLEGLLSNTLSRRKDLTDNTRALNAALSAFASYGKKSKYLTVASNKQLKKVTGKKLRAELSRLLKLEHRTHYYGPRSADEAAKIVDLGSSKIALRSRVTRKYRRVTKPKLYFVHKEMAQAQIGMTIPNGPMPKSEYAKMEILSNYLGGGMGGLIFQEMREARGLAYSARATYRSGSRPNDDSALVATIGTQADKSVTSASVMLELLRAAVQPKRVSLAQKAVDQSYRSARIDPRWLAAWVSAWDERGESSDPRPVRWEQAKAVSAEQLQVWLDTFSSKPIIVTVLGDRNLVDLVALEKIFGASTELTADDIFGY